MIAWAQKIIDRADADGLAPNHMLRIAATRLNAMMRAYIDGTSKVRTRSVAAVFCNTKKLWKCYSGEEL
jgi:hypothetical protein